MSDVVVPDLFGFSWGPVTVRRTASVERSNGTNYMLTVSTDAEQSIDIYVSPTGRSIRVFKGHKEMKVTDE